MKKIFVFTVLFVLFACTACGMLPDTGGADAAPPASTASDTEEAIAADVSAEDGLDPNDLAGAIAKLPRSDAVDVIWQRLGGYWTAADNLFAGFVLEEGVPGIRYGMWETEDQGFGRLAASQSTGAYTAEFYFLFAAVAANEVTDGRPETVVRALLDVSGLDRDGGINIQIAGHGSGDWYTYAFGGETAQDAYHYING